MPNIFETMQDLSAAQTTVLVKDRKALDLQASSNKASQVFKLVTVDLLKVPSLSAGIDDGPLCIDLNVDRLRKTSTGFIPKIIILSGADTLREKKKKGDLACKAWVGERAIAKTNIVIGEVPKDIAAGVSMLQMIRDGRNFESPALGGYVGHNPASMADAVDFGAPGSELNNPMLKLMLNVEDAIAIYQQETSAGVHKVTYSPYAPIPPGLINAAKEAKIAASDAGMNLEMFSAYDFLKWQHKKMSIKASNRTKDVNGVPLEASAFAYVGLSDDISTWHLPMHTDKAAKKSYNILAATHFVPKADKAEARANLERRMKAAGNPGSGKTKEHSKQPHKFIKDMEADKCKTCGNAMTHPLHKVMSAGGPGSGRHAGQTFVDPVPVEEENRIGQFGDKPKFGALNRDKLNRMHNTLTKKGYTPTYSSAHPSKTMVTHYYQKKDSMGNQEGIAWLNERSNGYHNSNLAR